MGQTYFKIWIHLVWSTKDRQPYLHQSFQKEVFQHIKTRAEEEEIHVDLINGVVDHIHCLLSLNPKYALSNVVNTLKGESSHWLNTQNFLQVKFAWQRGYSAFSVSESLVPKVRQYILQQAEHHRKMSYAEELQELLQRHNIAIESMDAILIE